MLHETSPRYYNAMEHEGGMKVQIETGTSDELPFSSEDLDTAVKVLHSIGSDKANRVFAAHVHYI